MIKLPPHLTLELTAKCNYACPYCYCVWHESGKRPPRDRSTDQWKKIRKMLLAGIPLATLVTCTTACMPESPHLVGDVPYTQPEYNDNIMGKPVSDKVEKTDKAEKTDEAEKAEKALQPLGSKISAILFCSCLLYCPSLHKPPEI